jgi:hypothetical protein
MLRVPDNLSGWHRLVGGYLGDLLPPPPAEDADRGEHQAGQASADDGTGERSNAITVPKVKAC